MNTDEARERLIAEQEGDTAHDSDAYFKARPPQDVTTGRMIFDAAHKRGWNAGYQQGIKDSELVSMGYWYQHEETGVIGTVDSWQVEQGFFKNNPRFINCGEVFRKALKEAN